MPTQTMMRPLARAVVLAAAGVVALVPLQAMAQIDTPIGEVPVPTTLPRTLIGGGDDGPGGNLPGGTTPTTTAPTTAPAPVEQPRTVPGGTTTPIDPPAAATEAPASSSRRSGSSRSTGVADPAGPTTLVERLASGAPTPPAIARLRRVTVPAARQFGFPLGLAGLVLAFLAVQSRLDARDPKLAAAPVTVDDDLLPFL